MNENPYDSPQTGVDAPSAAAKSRWVVLLSCFGAVLGIYSASYFLVGFLLYSFVYGDNSSTFGRYALAVSVVPAGVGAVFVIQSALRQRKTPIIVTLVVTLPFLLLFLHGIVRYGL